MKMPPRFVWCALAFALAPAARGNDIFVTGAGAGSPPLVHVFDAVTGRPGASFLAFDSRFTGGVSVAAGDFSGQGSSSVVVGAGPGGGPMVVIHGSHGELLSQFFAFDPNYFGGLNVAVGDVNEVGAADIIVGQATAPGTVTVFDGRTLQPITTSLPFQEPCQDAHPKLAGDSLGSRWAAKCAT